MLALLSAVTKMLFTPVSSPFAMTLPAMIAPVCAVILFTPAANPTAPAPEAPPTAALAPRPMAIIFVVFVARTFRSLWLRKLIVDPSLICAMTELSISESATDPPTAIATALALIPAPAAPTDTVTIELLSVADTSRPAVMPASSIVAVELDVNVTATVESTDASIVRVIVVFARLNPIAASFDPAIAAPILTICADFSVPLSTTDSPDASMESKASLGRPAKA